MLGLYLEVDSRKFGLSQGRVFSGETPEIAGWTGQYKSLRLGDSCCSWFDLIWESLRLGDFLGGYHQLMS